MGRLDRGEECRHRGRIGQVGGDRVSVRADGRRDALEVFEAASGQDDGEAGCAECDRNGFADTGTGARHQGDLPICGQCLSPVLIHRQGIGSAGSIIARRFSNQIWPRLPAAISAAPAKVFQRGISAQIA